MAVKQTEDLFARASRAAEMVATMTKAIKDTRAELKKYKAEAVALRRQVLDALGRKPRQRKPKERVIATMPDVVLGENCAHGFGINSSCQLCGREIPGAVEANNNG